MSDSSDFSEDDAPCLLEAVDLAPELDTFDPITSLKGITLPSIKEKKEKKNISELLMLAANKKCIISRNNDTDNTNNDNTNDTETQDKENICSNDEERLAVVYCTDCELKLCYLCDYVIHLSVHHENRYEKKPSEHLIEAHSCANDSSHQADCFCSDCNRYYCYICDMVYHANKEAKVHNRRFFHSTGERRLLSIGLSQKNNQNNTDNNNNHNKITDKNIDKEQIVKEEEATATTTTTQSIVKYEELDEDVKLFYKDENGRLLGVIGYVDRMEKKKKRRKRTPIERKAKEVSFRSEEKPKKKREKNHAVDDVPLVETITKKKKKKKKEDEVITKKKTKKAKEIASETKKNQTSKKKPPLSSSNNSNKGMFDQDEDDDDDLFSSPITSFATRAKSSLFD